MNNNELLMESWKEYNSIKQQIKELHKEKGKILDSIQALCPHKNIEKVEDFYMDYAKCKDCGKIIE